jgi:DNA-binding NtrC family response regulator
MGLLMEIENRTGETQPLADLTPSARDMARILIVCETDSDTDKLKTVFQEAGLTSESVNSIVAGCESARSGRFGVIFSTPCTGDGSWKSLIEVANQCDLKFEIILFARAFELDQWAEAMQIGAFDVLDFVFDLPRAAEVAQHAFGAAYLKRFRTRADEVQNKTRPPRK